MPFREIKPLKDYIRISKDYTTICITLVRRHFNDKKVRVFCDTDNKLIGFQPSNEGYKIISSSGHRRIRCSALSSLTQGTFIPSWSEKEKMLIFSYKPQTL